MYGAPVTGPMEIPREVYRSPNAGSMTNVRRMEAEQYAAEIGAAFDISRQQKQRSNAIARAKNRQMERASKQFGVR